MRSSIAALAAIYLILAPSLSAHPMGNFSISHYAGIRIERGFVEVTYMIDMAEIPTFQEIQQTGIVAKADDPRVQAYLANRAESFEDGLSVTINGKTLPLEVITRNILFPQGAGGLPTMKLGIVYRAALPSPENSRCELLYHDSNFSGRAGWKEIVLTQGEGIVIESSSASGRDRSAQLSNYPTDLINSPPQELEARIVFLPAAAATSARLATARLPRIRASSGDNPPIATMQTPKQYKASSLSNPAGVPPRVELRANQQSTPRNAFTELMNSQQIGVGVVLLAAFIAAALGALHALEPGHGKTIVAAYLVGSKGTAWHAFVLGSIVTASHTAGVYLLGAVTLYAQKYILPDGIYPYLGALSGILIGGTGAYLFLQRYLGEGYSHTHNRQILAQGQVGPGTTQRQLHGISPSQLLVLGITGGIVPCPAALVVLLSAVALHRTVFGLYLIVMFSLGLAAVLIAMGMITVYAGRLMSRLHLEGPLVQKWLPMGSAAVITFLGFGMTLRSLTTAGLLHVRISW